MKCEIRTRQQELTSTTTGLTVDIFSLISIDNLYNSNIAFMIIYHFISN